MTRMLDILTVVMVLAGVLATGAQAQMQQNASAAMAGKKFTINNVTPFDGIPSCPYTDPSTVAFHPNGTNSQNGTVTIVGEFAAADIGVCDNGLGFPVPSNVTIGYEVYGDWIIFRVPDNVATAVKLFTMKGKAGLYTIGVQDLIVSILTYAGSAT